MFSLPQEIIIDKDRFILRPAKDNDYDFVFNLLKENMLDSFIRNWGSWNDKSFKDNYHKENIHVVEHNNLLVGYIDFKFKSDCGYINNIQLSSKIQGKGLGTHLMTRLEKETLNHNLKKIRLKVFKDNRAIQLYYKLKYKPLSEDDCSIIMEKNI